MLFENNNAKLTGKNTALVFFLTKGLHHKREAKLFSTVVLKNTFDRLLLNFMKKLYYKNFIDIIIIINDVFIENYGSHKKPS